MLDKALFVEFYRHLEVAHSWRRAEDNSVEYFYGKIAQGIDDAAFCQIADYLTEASHLSSPKDFLNAIRESIRRKAAESAGVELETVRPVYDCDEFMRFTRFLRQLNAVDGPAAKRQLHEQFKQYWDEPISQDDRLYSTGHQVDRIAANFGLNLDQQRDRGSDIHAA